jgi:hypothetical protein
MKFLREWLRIDRPSGVAPHASQTLDIALPYRDAFDACVRGVEDVLGGVVRERDDCAGTFEATFGLINSERLTCALERIGDRHTRVTVTSRRGASAEPARPSQYVHALAEFLQSDAR